MAWVYPQGLQKVINDGMELTGIWCSSGNGSNCVSPLMLSKEAYQLIGVQVDHIYLTTHIPHSISPTRKSIWSKQLKRILEFIGCILFI
jgi:hypothetical protein